MPGEKKYPRKLAPPAKRAIWSTRQSALFDPRYLEPASEARTFWPPRVQESDVLARYRSFRVVARALKESSFTVRAERRSDGESLGYVNVQRNGLVMQVRSAYLHQAHGAKIGKGIGTRLYENAARLACAHYGAPLASDGPHRRSEYAEGFWSKQEGKGRATCEDSGYDSDNNGDLDGARGRRRRGRGHSRRLGMGPFTTTAYPESFREHIKCKGVYVLSCPAPSSLTGARRKRRARR